MRRRRVSIPIPARVMATTVLAIGVFAIPTTGTLSHVVKPTGNAVPGDELRTTVAAATVADELLPSLARSAFLTAGAPGGADSVTAVAPLHAVGGPTVEETDGPEPSIHDPATARLLDEEVAGTYLDDLLDAARPALTRWPARGDTPVRYWLQPGTDVPDFTPGNDQRVGEAFAVWEQSGIPLSFVQTPDSTEADIIVVWASRFDEPISGRTRWMHDRRGWIRSARVTIALHRYTGELLDGDALHAIALHEVGHALGMDHSSDLDDVMAPRVHVRTLSDADRATARLLYRLPAGLHR